MRLISVRMMRDFDMELEGSSRNWARDQRVFKLWEKGPLNVKLNDVDRVVLSIVRSCAMRHLPQIEGEPECRNLCYIRISIKRGHHAI